MSASKSGFTIVELLVVIVVIGVLAAITTVAYNGLQTRARTSAAQAMANQASKKVMAYYVTNSSYPTDLTTADIPDTTGLQYSVNNGVSPATYCITATSGNISYYISSTQTTPVSGGCAGHGQGGVAAITNYAKDPDATVATNFGQSGGAPAQSTYSIATDQVHHGTTSFKRNITAAGSSGTSAAAQIPTGALTVAAGQKFSWSFWVYSTRAGTISPYSDGAKVADGSYAGCGSANVTIPANAWTKVTATCTASVDMRPTQAGGYNLQVQAGDTVWFDEYLIVAGGSLPNYADGNSTNWVWNGTPNSSTSTGPAL